MFREREIILAFVTDIHPPKKKFFITLYNDDDLNVVACITTSQHRAPIAPEDVTHGVLRKDNSPVAYVFEQGHEIGVTEGGEVFSFRKRTFISFDYCFQQGTLDKFMARTQNPEVVGILDPKEFVALLYAMYKSPYTQKSCIPFIEKALQKHCK